MSKDHRDLLATMDREAFLRSVRRARSKSAQRDSSQKLLMWAERLLPYLDDNPQWTVAKALERYWTDRGAKRKTD
jgi:hypothetical protein